MVQGLGLKFDKLFRSFGRKDVLRGFELTVAPGEVVCLRGDNGAGKTTLLKICATVIKPTSGTVKIGQFCVVEEPRRVREKIGWMPSSDGGFISGLTGRQNLILFGSFIGLSKSQVWDSINRWASFSALELALETPFYLCSAGMKQSLLFARTVLKTPAVLLLDEPTRNLDQNGIHVLSGYLKSELRGTTVLFSSHSNEVSRAWSDREIQFGKGEP